MFVLKGNALVLTITVINIIVIYNIDTSNTNSANFFNHKFKTI